MEEKLIALYSDQSVERLDPVNGRHRYFSCIKNPEDQTYYCKKDMYIKIKDDNRIANEFVNVSICKYIPEKLVGNILSMKYGYKYIE